MTSTNTSKEKNGNSKKNKSKIKYVDPAESIYMIYKQLLDNSNIISNEKWSDFDKERQPDKNISVYNNIREFSHNISDNLGISKYLYSVFPGCGKSLLAKCAGKEALRKFAEDEYHKNQFDYQRRIIPFHLNKLTRVYYLNVRDYIEDLLAGYNGDQKRQSRAAFCENKLLKPSTRLIILDDVFTQTRTTMGKISTIEIKKLYSWTEHWLERNNSQKKSPVSIIFTSNYKFNEFTNFSKNNPFYPDKDNMVVSQKTASRIWGLLGGKKNRQNNTLVMSSEPDLDFRMI